MATIDELINPSPDVQDEEANVSNVSIDDLIAPSMAKGDDSKERLNLFGKIMRIPLPMLNDPSKILPFGYRGIGKFIGKTALGTAQELSKFEHNIPKLFGSTNEYFTKTPEYVDTGFKEKLGAGLMEALLGGVVAGSVGAALPVIGKGVEAAKAIPKIGKYVSPLVSPMAKRIAGFGAMGAVDAPENPLFGAITGAATSALMEGAGAKGPQITRAAWDKLSKFKHSPFHSMMMPYIKKEFNGYLGGLAKKLGIDEKGDVERAMMDHMESWQEAERLGAKKLYQESDEAFKEVEFPKNIRSLISSDIGHKIKRKKFLFSESKEPESKKAVSELRTIYENRGDPIKFKRKIHKAQRRAAKVGNLDLGTAFREIESGFDKTIDKVAKMTDSPKLTAAFEKFKIANNNFRDRVVPIRERGTVHKGEGKYKDIPTAFFGKHLSGGSKGIGDSISNIEDLRHAVKTFPKIKDYLALHHLKDGFDDPSASMGKYGKLSKEQRDIIFSPEWKERLDKFEMMMKKMPSSFSSKGAAGPIFGSAMAAAAMASRFVPHSLSAAGVGINTLGGLGGLAGLGGLGLMKLASKVPAIREAHITGSNILPPGVKLPPEMKERLIRLLTAGTVPSINE